MECLVFTKNQMMMAPRGSGHDFIPEFTLVLRWNGNPLFQWGKGVRRICLGLLCHLQGQISSKSCEGSEPRPTAIALREFSSFCQNGSQIISILAGMRVKGLSLYCLTEDDSSSEGVVHFNGAPSCSNPEVRVSAIGGESIVRNLPEVL